MTAKDGIYMLAAAVIILMGFVGVLIVWITRLRRMTAQNHSTARRRRSLSAAVLMGMALVSLSFVIVIVAVGLSGDGHQTLMLPLLLISGVAVFLSTIAALVFLFVRNGLSNRNYALGLPDGSIRAIIALSLILLFAILAVFLYVGQGGFGDRTPTADQSDLAKQLVTTLSTLVVAISSFYFGSTTVREARKPETERPEGPLAPPTLPDPDSNTP